MPDILQPIHRAGRMSRVLEDDGTFDATTAAQERGTDVHEKNPSPHGKSVTHVEKNASSSFLERQTLESIYRRIGRPAVKLELWDGYSVCDEVNPLGRIAFRSADGLSRVVTASTLGFGEGYMSKEIEVDGDLIEVLTEVNRAMTEKGLDQPQRPFVTWPRFSMSRFWTKNASSKKCVEHHYDLGNDFYRLWLDRQLVYTCAYYPRPETTLEEAQTAKLDYVCRKLRLVPGDTVIEAGCGWGALAIHMARHYGVTVRAFNLSREQMKWAQTRAQSENLASRIEFITDDYRNVTGKADVFVSVGMLEHVGRSNYQELGRIIDRTLTRRGRGFIHSIGRNSPRPLDPWTLKYIFPGAYAPSLSEMMEIFEGPGFSICDVENLRQHYARTCSDWLYQFESQSHKICAMFDDRFVRMWRLYLAASAAAFRNGNLQLFQILFTRSPDNRLPWTRQDWYE